MTAAPWKVATAMLLAAVVALLVCLLVVAGQRNEARRARDSAVATVGVLAGNLATCQGNTETLQAGINKQNKAVADLAEEARTRQEAVARALQTAQGRTHELLAQNGVLHEIIRTTKPETCDATFDAARAGLRR